MAAAQGRSSRQDSPGGPLVRGYMHESLAACMRGWAPCTITCLGVHEHACVVGAGFRHTDRHTHRHTATHHVWLAWLEHALYGCHQGGAVCSCDMAEAKHHRIHWRWRLPCQDVGLVGVHPAAGRSAILLRQLARFDVSRFREIHGMDGVPLLHEGDRGRTHMKNP